MQEAEELARTGEQAGCLHVGAHTPGALAAAYSRLCAAQTGMQNDLDRIEQRILEDDGVGAYLCSYDTFCAISRVRMRAAARSDTPLLLVTASLLPPVPRPAAGRTAAVMQVMEDVLLCTLRSSDVAARYSENRFVLLLKRPPARAPTRWNACALIFTAARPTTATCWPTACARRTRARNARTKSAMI